MQTGDRVRRCRLEKEEGAQIGDRERRCRLETAGCAVCKQVEDTDERQREGADWRRGEKYRLETGGGDAGLRYIV